MFVARHQGREKTNCEQQSDGRRNAKHPASPHAGFRLRGPKAAALTGCASGTAALTGSPSAPNARRIPQLRTISPALLDLLLGLDGGPDLDLFNEALARLGGSVRRKRSSS
jgi:hypothetical protein